MTAAPLGNDVTIVLHDLRGGGAERVMLNLARGMIDQGRSVTLLLINAQGDYLDTVPTSATVIDLQRRNVFKAIPAIARYIRGHRPSVLLSALPHMNIALILAKIFAAGKSRVVVTEHNQITLKASGARGLRRRLTYFLIPFLYRRANAVVAVSQGVAADIEAFAKLPQGSVRCIHNPSFTPNIALQASERPEHPWFHDDGPPILIAAGRLHKQKAYNILLRAMALVRHHTDVRLLVIGEGDERAYLEALRAELGLNDIVCFAGFAANPYAMMANARMLVLSSAWEGLPTVLIEAMACDLPIVSTDCPSGPREILLEGQYGWLVPVGDPVALADGIMRGLSEPKRGGPIRAQAFSVEASAKQYLEVLDLR